MADAATAIGDVIDPLKSSFSELQGNRHINICAAGANSVNHESRSPMVYVVRKAGGSMGPGPSPCFWASNEYFKSFALLALFEEMLA